MSTTQPIRNPEQLRTFKSYYQRENPNSRNYILIITGRSPSLAHIGYIKSDLWRCL